MSVSPEIKSKDRGFAEVHAAVKNAVYSEDTQNKVAHLLQKLQPLLNVLSALINALAPVLEKIVALAVSAWKALEPYHPLELTEAALGLFMCFFGGVFMVTIACVEAFRQTGWKKTWSNIVQIYEHYKEVRMHYKKDDQVDANADGRADVLDLDKKALFTRKMALVLRVTDPVRMEKLATGVYLGFMGVIAILRLQFAQTIMLGAAIGDAFHEVAEKYLNPLLTRALPDDYSKWVPIFVRYACKSVGASIAFFIARVVGSVYACLRGGRLVATSVLQYALARNKVSSADPSSLLFVAIMSVTAMLGFLFQLTFAWGVPFPLSILLFPVSVLERFLMYFVAYGPEVAASVTP